MFTTIALLSLAFVPTPAVRGALSSDRPRIELWTNRGEGAVVTRSERERRSLGLSRYRGWPSARRSVRGDDRSRPAHRSGGVLRLGLRCGLLQRRPTLRLSSLSVL